MYVNSDLFQLLREDISEEEAVFTIREAIKELFKGLDIQVTIGGSYALKHYCFDFSREPHDYDFIIRGWDKDKALAMLWALYCLRAVHTGPSGGVSKVSYVVGSFKGKMIDIIPGIDIPKRNYGPYENLQDVLDAKREYIEEGCDGPRQKDIEDIKFFEGML